MLDNILVSPKEYQEASVVADEVGKDMLGRLDLMAIQPEVILEVGCGAGLHSNALSQRYPSAKMLALDLSETMLRHGQSNSLPNINYICANNAALPLPNQSVDLVFANFFLPWQMQVAIHFQEWQRVLRPNGLVMLSALGLDTLQEWQQIFPAEQRPHLVDMHDVGDALIQAGFSEPVLDVTHFTVTYRDPAKLLHELSASLMWLPPDSSSIATLAVKAPLAVEGVWPLSFEIITAHAFAPMAPEGYSAESGTVKIPLAHLRNQLKSKN